jgi:hypothetical protein
MYKEDRRKKMTSSTVLVHSIDNFGPMSFDNLVLAIGIIFLIVLILVWVITRRGIPPIA